MGCNSCKGQKGKNPKMKSQMVIQAKKSMDLNGWNNIFTYQKLLEKNIHKCHPSGNQGGAGMTSWSL